MQLPHDHDVELIADADSARAVLEAGKDHPDPILRMVVAAVAAARQLRRLRLAWTKGHNGQPWKELCDSLSEFYERREPPPLPGYPRKLFARDRYWS